MFKLFKKREEIFYKLIEEQADITYEGLKLLEKYLKKKSPKLPLV